mmetsp:Transcript_14567/g.14518  ORF Transcript_14567/g.14518 Transcript_14567/m.14518 type:complete len:333 (-) Transcript_14567:270-1268(-)
MENRITIDENYIKEVRDESPTDLFHNHLLQRDDDPNEELEEEIALLKKYQSKAYSETIDIIQNFILDAFDEDGRLFEESNCQSGTTINTVYGKLREVAYKHLLRNGKNYDSKTRAITKMLFISKVDGEIFENVRQEAVYYYKKQIGEGKIPLPEEIKNFQDLISKYGIKDKLYQCIAEWYVEAEVSVDIVRRIQMYGILEGHREKLISKKLRKAWELRSNYYIDLEAAFLSMICYLGTKLLAQFNSGFFEVSKITIMMKIIYFIIFRSAISTPIIAAALFSTLGTVFLSLGLQLLFSKLADYKRMREVELAFRDFKVITSNLTWDNQLLQKL